ncbi:hypothetical protein AMQ84_00960 [Paenibacillus riograndensis]|uniref:Uncharacterized protein n=1 Tax=Paenibacillus riograndensis TaxID=483937 RepID=A0A132UCM9_9BACL|nr:hypothetical protein [Paenibacillus riograndensis]KWX81126.1 hypothetical protein AMQ84_00960 [Paenibacillus riograndensis]
MTNSNNFAIELKKAKAKEAARPKRKKQSRAVQASNRRDASSSKPGSAQASSSIFNKVAKTAKTAAVGVFNFVIGDDLKATFGKNSSATERVIGGASIILTVATLGEGKVVTSGLKGAGKLAGKVFAKDVAETVVVKETTR